MDGHSNNIPSSESYAQSTGPAAIIAPPTSKYAVEQTPLSQQSSELLHSPQLRFPSIRKWTDKGFAMLFFLQLIILVIIYFSGGNARREYFETHRGHFPPHQGPPPPPTNSSSSPGTPAPPPRPPKDHPDHDDDDDSYHNNDKKDRPPRDSPDKPSDYDNDSSNMGSNSTVPEKRRRSCLTNEDSEVVVIQIIFMILLSLIFSISLLKLIKKQPRWFHLFMGSSVLSCIVGAIVFFCAAYIASMVLNGHIFKQFMVLAVLLAVLAVIQIISIVVFRKRIAFASQVMQTAASLLLEIPSTVRLSYVTLVAQSLWGFFWIWTLRNALFLEPSLLLFAFLLFSLYWTSQVIKYSLHTTCSGSFASWYFVAPDAHDNAYTSLKRTLTTSFGSVCFGALLTSIISLLNWVLPLCICEIIARYFNRYAFVQVATYGKSYCQSAKSTINLFRLHGFEAIANDDLTIIVMFGMCATLLNIGIIFAYVLGILIDLEPEEHFSLLLLMLGVLSVMLATTIEVLDSAIVTLFVCFVEQPERLRQTKPEFYELFRESYGNNCPLFENDPQPSKTETEVEQSA